MSKTAWAILSRTALATLLLATVSACSSWDTPQAKTQHDAATTGSPINNPNPQDTTNRDRGN
ncbi:MAG: hypothetical protein WCC64_06105 [Aliidongia sp.]|jgi:hypothetical protein